MHLSFATYIFTCLSLSMVGASTSLDELLNEIKDLKALNKDLNQRVKTLETKEHRVKGAASSGRKSIRSARILKGDSKAGSYDKDRNICYSQDDTISAFVQCEAFYDDDGPSGDADCDGGSGRRYLTAEEAEKNLKTSNRKLCSDGEDFADDLTVENVAAFPLGQVLIKTDESLMVELTATTLSFVSSQLAGWANGWSWEAESDTGAMAGVYVTAVMYEGCDSLVSCASATKVVAEPSTRIPLQAVFQYNEETLDFDIDDWYYAGVATTSNHTTAVHETTTAKLFFPDSNLVDDETYFLALEFSVEISASARACSGSAFASAFAGATLGPYIIDAQIIKDADFGNCAWVDSTKFGCGMFDDPSKDVDCD